MYMYMYYTPEALEPEDVALVTIPMVKPPYDRDSSSSKVLNMSVRKTKNCLYYVVAWFGGSNLVGLTGWISQYAYRSWSGVMMVTCDCRSFLFAESRILDNVFLRGKVCVCVCASLVKK